jgi:hypothetical protein
MATTALTKTFGSASSASDRYKFTFSTWFKRGVAGDNDYLFGHQSSDGANDFAIRLDKDSGNPRLRVYDYQSSSYNLHKQTTRFFRDHSAWYHLVVKIDTTQLSASDRVKIYINGVEETSFSTSVDPSQNQSVYAFSNTGQPTVISGRYTNSLAAGYYFDGSLTHTHCCIGYAYDASDFGQTNATSGIWTPKTAPSVTYGSNGFFLKFENSGAMGTDSSGNSNTFTVNGTLTQNVDTPSNNFATLNPLSTHGNNTLTAGNTKISFTANTSYTNSIGNIGVNNGRWYAECKLAGVTTYYPALGIASMGNATNRYYDPLYTGAHLGADEGTAYFKHGNIQAAGSNVGNYASFTTGDIIGMYLDLESATKTLKYYKNDGLIVSINITPVDGQFYTFGATGTSSSDIADFNFGGGYFGTTAVASANADANGFGAFEYSPTLSGVNYYALCTKNIKEFG